MDKNDIKLCMANDTPVKVEGLSGSYLIEDANFLKRVSAVINRHTGEITVNVKWGDIKC